MVDASSPAVRATVLKRPGGTLRAVVIPAGERLCLRQAQQATCLRTFPSRPDWATYGERAATLRVRLQESGADPVPLVEHALEPAAPPKARTNPRELPRVIGRLLGRTTPTHVEDVTVPASNQAADVVLAWPIPVPQTYDLHLEAEGGEIAVAVGPLMDMRTRLVPLLRGSGVEVGPGANPSVLPSEGRRVRYVEKMSQAQWAATYAKKALDPAVTALWDDYAIDSAHGLDSFADASLDFIFSSHVFEHLVNPLQVLLNWWNRLAPGGVIAGVVPDARFTFDLRQPLTTLAELHSQFEKGGHVPDAAMYERWCRHTAPCSSADSLRDRDYAIHVNYFSPDVFRLLLDAFSAQVSSATFFLESFPNGKDFGFAVVKP